MERVDLAQFEHDLIAGQGWPESLNGLREFWRQQGREHLVTRAIQVSVNGPMADLHAVLAGREAGRKLAQALPDGPVEMDFQHVGVISPSYLEELLRAHPRSTAVNLNEDTREVWGEVCARLSDEWRRTEAWNRVRDRESSTQEWFCEQCSVRSSVEVPVGATVYEIVNAIDADHQAASPRCSTNVRGLRIEVGNHRAPEAHERSGDADRS